MISILRSHSATKDSGIGWIGKIPTTGRLLHFETDTSNASARCSMQKQVTGKHLMPYLRNVDVQWDRINVSDLRQIDIRPEEVERYTVEPGDLLVCEGGEVGRAAIWEGEIHPCAFQKALHRLRPRQTGQNRPRFLLYALQLARERGAFHDGHESTIGHLTGEKLRAHRFAFPPETEQKRIATFLDHMTRRIRRYIRAKHKLIALLEEQKQAIIHQAVTGQIDVRTGQPYRTYKDSGIDSLGLVPAHWQVQRLRNTSQIRVSNVDKHAKEGQRPCVSATTSMSTRMTTFTPVLISCEPLHRKKK